MMRALIFLLFFAAPAAAAPVVADISTYRVAIDAGFRGTRLFIFGARGESGDVVVALRGPERNFTVRKKERIGGIWVNSRQQEFKKLPQFYAVASTRPLDTISSPELLTRLKLGREQLLPPPVGTRQKENWPEFSAALFSHLETHRLYDETIRLGFMGETLFKAIMPLPDTIPEGDYTAEIYLLSGDTLEGMQVIPVRVEKTGFDAVVAHFARTWPALYGLLAIAMAVSAGWIASRIFGRQV